MLDGSVTFVLVWLLIGALIWMFRSSAHIAGVQCAYWKRGEAATAGQLGLHIAKAIAWWPRLVTLKGLRA
jgi:hypothetical protein